MSIVALLATSCNSPQQTYTQNPVAPQATSTPVLTTNQKANWKNYTNTDYGFEFQYPQNLSFDIKSTQDFGLIITGSYASKNIEDWIKSAKKYDSDTHQANTYTSITVGGVAGVSVHDPDQSTKADEVFFIKNSKLYDLVFKTVDQKTADQIIQSFKFTR